APPRGAPARASAPARPLLVPLQSPPNAQRPPLVLVHPVGGYVYFYRALAAALGADQPVVGVRARGLAPGETTPEDLETLARDYVDALVERQPRGPYLLGGSSLGGMVAWTMARLLRADGAEVALVTMLDTGGPGHMPQPPQDDVDLLVRLFGDRLPLDAAALRAVPSETERLRRLLRHARDAEVALPTSGYDLAAAQRHLGVVRGLMRAMYAHRPQPLDQRVTFFRARVRRPHEPAHPELGWTDLCQAGIEVHVVPGNHLSMHDPPHLDVLAPRLRDAIDRALREIDHPSTEPSTAAAAAAAPSPLIAPGIGA
ncbi:MAG: alpha/beta fold hydrolase, partial [Acidobacteriota bacterium]